MERSRKRAAGAKAAAKDLAGAARDLAASRDRVPQALRAPLAPLSPVLADLGGVYRNRQGT